MAGASSPGDLLRADGGLTRWSPNLHELHSKGSGTDCSLKSSTPDDCSPSNVKLQQGRPTQLGDTQPTATNVVLDENTNLYHIYQSDKCGLKSPFYPAAEGQVLEAIESFAFAPQPKHEPNQFFGRQEHRNLDFEVLEAPNTEAERPVVDKPNPESGNPRQSREKASSVDSRGHHHEVAGARTGDTSCLLLQEEQVQPVPDAHDSNYVEATLDHVSNRARMPIQPTYSGRNAPFERYAAGAQVSGFQRYNANQHKDSTTGGGLNGRPFADADIILPGNQRTSPHEPGQTIVVDSSCTVRHNSSRTGIDEMVQRPQVSDRTTEIKEPAKMSRLTDSNTAGDTSREHQHHTSRTIKQHIKTSKTRSETLVGDLELPRRRTPNTSCTQRIHPSPQGQLNRPVIHEEDELYAPRHTASRQSDISRHRRAGHRQERQNQPTQEEPRMNSQGGRRIGHDHVQKSHFGVLKSIINHHNMFLEDAKLTEENLKNEIDGQVEHISILEARLERSHLRHQQEQGHRKNLASELSLLQQQKQQLINTATQHEGQRQELEKKVAGLQAQRAQQSIKTSRLENELEGTQSKLIKLQEKSRGYKDHLNKAIAEHQKLWQQSKDISQKAIEDIRKEHLVSAEKFQLALEDKQAAQEKLNRIFNDKKALLQQGLDGAASNIKRLKSTIDQLEGDLDAEAYRATRLEEQLHERRCQENLLLRIEEKAERITEKLDGMGIKSEQANAVPVCIRERLDKIAEYVQSAPRADVGDDIRQVMKTFWGEMMSHFLREVKNMMAGQSTVEEKLQNLEKSIQDQSTLAQTQRIEQQEQLLQKICEKKEESNGLLKGLQAKDVQVTEMTNTIIELTRKIQELEASTELVLQNTTTSNTELQILQEVLVNREHQVSETQVELRLQREGHETTLRELRARLRDAEEDVRQKNELLNNSSNSVAAVKRDLTAVCQEEQRELELQLRHSEDSRQAIQKQLSESKVELERLKTLEAGSEVLRLQKELNDAHQRITNLTIKLRESQTSAVDSGVIDQLAEQLAQLNNLKNEICQLKTNGKTYTMVSKDIAEMLHRQDAVRGDDILAPDSLAIREPKLPDSPQGHGASMYQLDNFDFRSSEPRSIQSGKRAIFRSPVAEPDHRVPAPSVTQEKHHRREAMNQGYFPKPILRQQRTATELLEDPKKPLVTQHAGHSSYNRPVQGASRTSQATISDVRSSLVGNRKMQVSDLTSHGDWQQTEARGSQDSQRRAKRSSSVPPSSRRPKRVKPSFPVNGENNAKPSAAEGSNDISPQRIESSQRSDRDSTQAPQEQSQEEDRTSHHFHQSMPKSGTSSVRRENAGAMELRSSRSRLKYQSGTKACSKRGP